MFGLGSGSHAADREAQPKRAGHAEDEVDALDLQLQRPAAAGLGHEALALGDAAVGEDRVDLGDGAGVAGAAARRDLGGAPRRGSG